MLGSRCIATLLGSHPEASGPNSIAPTTILSPVIGLSTYPVIYLMSPHCFNEADAISLNNRLEHPVSLITLPTMSAIIDAFKIKPFDLEPVYASWSSPPIFIGNPKKDPSVDDWLDQIKAGCLERKVPKEYWHKVAQHNLGPAAKERFDEIKLVMGKVHGGNYRWNWKRFKVAMKNMGCKWF
jgi:hypothetical protein